MIKSNSNIYSLNIVDGNLLVVDPHCPYETSFFDDDDDDDEILGSCNGLICLFSVYFKSVWNPSTRERIILPDCPPRLSGDFVDYLEVSYGFGCDLITNDYKVVEVHAYHHDDENALPKARVTGKLTNGALHWMAQHCDTAVEPSELIISFHITSEEFKEVPLPEFTDGKVYFGMAVLVGSLCIIRIDTLPVELWVMKNYGVRESWTMFFSIGQHVYDNSQHAWCRPLCLLKNGEVLLDKNEEHLILYDLKDGRVRNICIRGLSKWDEMEIYVESLVTFNFEESQANGMDNGQVYVEMEGHAMNGATSEGSSSSSAPIYIEEQLQRHVERIVDERLSWLSIYFI
ncbi:hypothetical protein Sjap_005382 [Stephania japonica]|uniref:F-box associated beta-propeller type 3 domain-containing protein n=1 Tax=Stephania japonica TaxID=461633 RepID=A0AAP0PK07_9MAGN